MAVATLTIAVVALVAVLALAVSARTSFTRIANTCNRQDSPPIPPSLADAMESYFRARLLDIRGDDPDVVSIDLKAVSGGDYSEYEAEQEAIEQGRAAPWYG